MAVDRLTVPLPDERATEALGAGLARSCPPAAVIYLEGDLGAGKTTLARGFLRALGHHGRVKSPTYSLLETYDTRAGRAYHLDLYRLADPEETRWLGLDELESEPGIVLVEWPGNGAGGLPAPDLVVALRHAGQGREASLEGHGEAAAGMLAGVSSLTS